MARRDQTKLKPNLQPEDLLTGVTFASGGCGYDPLTTELASAIPLSDQLQLFKEYTEKVKQIVGEEGQNRIVKTAFVLVVAGSNDIDNTYFASRVRKLQYDISAYTDLIVGLASTFFKDGSVQCTAAWVLAVIENIGWRQNQRLCKRLQRSSANVQH
ncbi:hypothetical protein WN943_027461 [Citrus x changshan-huyou]